MKASEPALMPDQFSMIHSTFIHIYKYEMELSRDEGKCHFSVD